MSANSAKISRALPVMVAIVMGLKPEACRGEKNASSIDRIVRDWAPLIVFDEEEKYFPLGADEFLRFVHPVKSDGTPLYTDLPVGRSSQSVFLTTNSDLKDLMSGTSFLNGKNPSKFPVPIYATVTECPELRSQVKSSKSRASFFASYWFFFPYNEGKKVCFLATTIPIPFLFDKCLGSVRTMGNHVGDFEHVTISFDADYRPIEMYVSTHDIGAYYAYNKYAKVFKYVSQRARRGFVQNVTYPRSVGFERNRPVLFAARGSHGLWADRGTHKYHRMPDLFDRTSDGVKWKTWKQMEIYHLTSGDQPEWMKFFGRWGNPKKKGLFCSLLGICELSDAPHGIVDRPQDIYC